MSFAGDIRPTSVSDAFFTDASCPRTVYDAVGADVHTNRWVQCERQRVLPGTIIAIVILAIIVILLLVFASGAHKWIGVTLCVLLAVGALIGTFVMKPRMDAYMYDSVDREVDALRKETPTMSRIDAIKAMRDREMQARTVIATEQQAKSMSRIATAQQLQAGIGVISALTGKH